MSANDWQPVLNPMTDRYWPGFDRDKLYRFRRGKDGEVQSFRLSETNPYFNVAGLYFRDPFTQRA
jgi:hypothetical protein